MVDLITPQEAALWLNCDLKTLARRADRGLLRFTKTVGGHRRYYAQDVAAMAGTARPTPPPPPPAPAPAPAPKPAPPPRCHLDALDGRDAGVLAPWLIVAAHDRDLTRRGARVLAAIADELIARSRRGSP